ncbi:MAG TPA: CsbD family protein [Isosphaeraceae bacterium]|nr:CsbD family protein [Isosphaeraceae bacterium]
MINAQEIQGQWNKIKGQVKEKWGQLSENDLHIEGGNIDQLIGRIQQKTGEGREAIERYLSDLTSQGASSVNKAAEAARGYMGAAASRLHEGYDQAGQWAREGYGSAENLVRHRPGSSVAAAFGLGLVVGLVVGVSLRSR